MTGTETKTQSCKVCGRTDDLVIRARKNGRVYYRNICADHYNEARRIPGAKRGGYRLPMKPLACPCGEKNKANLVKCSASPTGYRRRCKACRKADLKAWDKTPGGRRYAIKRRAKTDTRKRQRKPNTVDPFYLTIGTAVRAWRKENGVTPEALATVLGLKPNSLNYRELGKRRWPPEQVRILIRLGVKIWDDEGNKAA